jgi:hypothetical protein
MRHSESITTIASAFVKAQAAFSPAVKAKSNPAFKGAKYVDLAGAIEAAEPALLANGIAVLQGVQGDIPQQSITVVTRLLHESGEWLEDSLTLPALNRGNFDPQSVGSAITYARRYAYMAMMGIPAEDDDGNAASDRSEHVQQTQQQAATLQKQASVLQGVQGDIPQQQAPRPQSSNTGPTISEAQSKRFFAMAKSGQKSNDDVRRYLMDVCHCERTLDIRKANYEAACKWAEELPQVAAWVYEPTSTEITDDDIPY